METFDRFVLSEDGTIRTVKVPREVALKEIDEILEATSDSTVSTFLVPNMDHYGIARGRWVTVGDVPTVSVVETPMLGSN